MGNSDQKYWTAATFPQMSSDQNFETVILFRIVKGFNSYVFEDDLPLTGLVEGFQAINFARCLLTVLAVGKRTNIFWGGGGFF